MQAQCRVSCAEQALLRYKILNLMSYLQAMHTFLP